MNRMAADALREVRIPSGEEHFEGELSVPVKAKGVVVFAHGSGSSRFSARNRQVASSLFDAGFATLLMDLLTPEESRIDLRTAEFRFDIPRLARRVIQATDWVRAWERSKDGPASLPIGYFGASTGAAAALIAAAERQDIAAVVSRGGRPDLAANALPRVTAPTLLIVGARDEPVIGMNNEAMSHMNAKVRLKIIAGATHLFEEPGALEQVAHLASDWFREHLGLPGQTQ